MQHEEFHNFEAELKIAETKKRLEFYDQKLEILYYSRWKLQRL